MVQQDAAQIETASGSARWTTGFWKQWLALDYRSLALMRIGVALLCLLDALNRLSFFVAHYSYLGVIPLSEQIGPGSRSSTVWSLAFLSDGTAWCFLLLVLYAVSALALALGYRSRLAGWLCWLLAVSLQRRTPMLNDSGDMYLDTLLVWGNLLPWGRAFSLTYEEPPDNDYRGLPGFGYIVQVAILYWFSAVLRTGQEWQVDNSALYYALSIPSMATAFGSTMLGWGTQLLGVVTALTLLLEQLGPILLFLPSARIRVLSVALLASFHFGILITIRIPFFATLCIIGALGLLPGRFWEWEPVSRGERALRRVLERVRKSVGLEAQSAPTREPRYLGVATIAVLGILIFHLHAGIFSLLPQTALSRLTENLNLNQRWGMFSPHATNVIGWETAVGRTIDGQEVDLLGGGGWPKKPSEYPNHLGFFEYRWRLYHQALSYGAPLPLNAYLRYLVNHWEQRHPGSSLVSAEYVYHPRVTAPHYLLGEEGDEVLAVWSKK